MISNPPPILANTTFWQNVLAYLGFQPRKVKGTPEDHGTDGGGRGNCPNLALAYDNKFKDIQLTALIPEVQPYPSSSLTPKSAKIIWSDTIKQRPNLWFYIPYKYDEKTQLKFAKFALIDEDKRLVTQPPFLFQLPKQPGIVQVKMPINLEVNKPYKWFFSIVCDENKPSRNPSVSGWIQRILPNKAGFVVEPSEDVLARISYRDIAKRGLWFDAFTRLAEVYQSTNPQSYIQSSVKSEKFTKSLDNQIQEDWLAVFKVLELGDDQITSEISKSPIFKLDCVSRTDGRKCE
ncbi:DUF928 domain-containing protein [Tolypothrix sp. VBCCA 56010]|uniref:DUF928 domain-containing protein n=1 Tax=Tolypothrix sp. VBCCA 56010 TaxID=3137731 RepID=UPI003D7C646E